MDPEFAALNARIVSGDEAREERAELIRRRRAEGWTHRRIAAAAGVSHQAVAKALRRPGVTPPA